MNRMAAKRRGELRLSGENKKDRLLRAVNGAAEILLTTDEDDFESSLREGMALMARCIDVDRVYIWQNKMEQGRLQYVQQFGWLSEGGASGRTVLPKTGFDYEWSMPEWEAKFLSGESVNGPVRFLSARERERLGPYGIKSILVTPVYLRDLFWGFVSYDDCGKERTFSEDEISILRSANLMFVSALNRHDTAAKIREADEHAKLMLDATPLCCSLWDDNYRLIDCNSEVVGVYGLSSKQEYLDRFFSLSPERQPDGRSSREEALKHVSACFEGDGRAVFEWRHQLPDGTPIPAEVTLVRVRRGEGHIVAGYTRDLREYKKMMSVIEYKDNLLHMANEVAAILLKPQLEEFENDLRKCLDLIAKSVGVDRVYICKKEENEGRLYHRLLYECSRESGTLSGGGEGEGGGSKVPAWEERLWNGQSINAIVRDLPPDEREVLSERGVLSVLAVPVFLHGLFWGFMGLDDRARERVFSDDEESVLRSCSLFIANTFLRNEMTRDIKVAVEKAQAASKAKSAFLARMSHEIRTPMNVIAGMTELILRENVPGTIREHVLNVKHSSASLLSLVNDILDFSKIEAGSLELVSSEYALTSLINNVLIIIRMRLSEKPILFTANIDCNIPNRLIGDEMRVRQVLLNVMDNAAKYTGEGFISLNVTGDVQGDTVIMKAEVADSGIGIRSEDMDMLFEDFVRFEGERNRKVQGTGLGLPITKSLCQAMGGSIAVHSVHGVGSTFTITIPQKVKLDENGEYEEKYADVADPEAKRVLLYERRFIYADSIRKSLKNLGVPCVLVGSEKDFTEELKRGNYPFVFVCSQMAERAAALIEELLLESRLVVLVDFGERPALDDVRTISMPVHAAAIANILNDTENEFYFNERGREVMRFIAPSADILVVDDLNTNLKVAEGLMLPYRMQIDVCSGGEEAIERVKDKRFDIIFMDHMMPGIDGIEATRRIRALGGEDGYFKDVPIIALTANAVSGVKEMFLENGMDDFLAKPIDVTKLHNLLEKWIPAEKKERMAITRRARLRDAENAAQVEIDGVDVKAGIAMSGGTTENYLKTLAIFLLDGLEKIKQIRECVEKEEIGLYTVYVHALKSASANIGAWVLSYLFKTLEGAGAKGNIPYIRENTERALEETEALLANVRETLARHKAKPAGESDPKSAGSGLARLMDALSNSDIGEANDAMKELETIKWGARSGDLFKQVSRNVLLINYEEASVLAGLLREAHAEECGE